MLKLLGLALLLTNSPDTSELVEPPPLPKLELPSKVKTYDDGSMCLTTKQRTALREYLRDWGFYPGSCKLQLDALDTYWRRIYAKEQERMTDVRNADVAVAEADAERWRNRLLWSGLGFGVAALIAGGVAAALTYPEWAQ